MCNVNLIGRIINVGDESITVDTQNNKYNKFVIPLINTSIFRVDQTVSFRLESGTIVDLEIVDRNKSKYNTEDKAKWYEEGEKLERKFIDSIPSSINRDIIIHPDKETNPASIDFYDLTNDRVADLKTQNTPFFTASKYSYDPTYTVTFNRKDYENYSENYPNAIIFWNVEWTQTTFRKYSVEKIKGVWEVPFQQLANEIESGNSPLHTYINRVNDDRNAQESYLFDLRTFEKLW